MSVATPVKSPATFFKLKSASTYDCRSAKTGALYVFSGDKPVKVDYEIDQEKFRNDKSQFIECDTTGVPLAALPGGSPGMSFTARGMVVPKTYKKLSRLQPAPASQTDAPTVAAPPAPRTITSSKAARKTSRKTSRKAKKSGKSGEENK